MILAVESSCDDTSVAIVDRSGHVVISRSLSQDESHRPFGGVVPEIASRRHTENLLPLVEICMSEANVSWTAITGLAVTSRPGLIGSLLVGIVTVKTLSLAKQIPFVGVNHIEGHLLSPLLRDATYAPPEGFTFPYLALIVSGGHTHLFRAEKPGQYTLLGRTLDDAAGEAFDKFGKLVGLGFPGGVAVDTRAMGGNSKAFAFPRAFMNAPHFNFSFSGLKTSALNMWNSLSESDRATRIPDLCASFQAAVVEVLVHKLRRATEFTGIKRWAIAGGVSANSGLRTRAQEEATKRGVQLALPPLRYCTDNAAMIGLAGLYRLERGETAPQDLAPSASSWPQDWSQAASCEV